MLLILIALGGMVVAAPLISLVVTVPTIFTNPATLGSPSTTLIRTSAAVQFISNAVLISLAIVGLVLITRRDPGHAGGPEGLSARRVVRLSCFLLPLPLLMNFALALNMPSLPAFTPGAPPPTPAAVFTPTFMSFIALSLVVGVAAAIVYTITPLALLRHLGSLLERIPRPGLVRFARIEFWGLSASAVVLAVGYVLIAATVLPALGSLTAAATTMPSATTQPGTVTVVEYPESGGSAVQVVNFGATSGPATGTASSAPASAPAGPPTLSSLGYVAPAASSVVTSMSVTLPSMAPIGPFSPRFGAGFFTGMLVGGGSAGLGGCGTLGFGIAGVVLLIMTCTALFAAGREARQNAELAAAPPARER